MIDLSQNTFIIPVRIESTDRYYNINAVLGYLNNHFKTNIKIFEVCSDNSRLDFLESLENLNIEYFYEKLEDDAPFHRTKYLNIMLEATDTELVSNYDCDVLLPTDVYPSVCNHLLLNKADFVYPFLFGKGQKKLNYSKWYDHKDKDLLYWSMMEFLKTFNLFHLDFEDTFITESESSYGHCFFAKTESYKKAFGENENFISYGPEDVERAERFQKLGYKVDWWHTYVYHLEHTRTNDSCKENLFFEKNAKLYNQLSVLNQSELIDYYQKINRF